MNSMQNDHHKQYQDYLKQPQPKQKRWKHYYTEAVFIFKNLWYQYRIAAIVFLSVLLMASIAILYYQFAYPNMTRTVRAKQNILTHYLPDSTEVVLNKGAVLKYRPKFENRSLLIEGEAHIKNNIRRPVLQLDNRQLNIQLSKGDFYVNYQPKAVLYQLITIKGSARADAKELTGRTILNVSEGACFSFDVASRLMQAPPIKDYNYLHWETGKLRYQHQPLVEVIPSLAEHFDTSIKLSNHNLEHCIFDGEYTSDRLQPILDSICQQLHLSIQQGDHSIVLVGKGCPMADYE